MTAKNQIRFGEACLPGAELSDAEFLKRLELRKSTTPQLKSAAGEGNPQQFAKRLRRTMTAGRRSPRQPLATPPLLQPLWSRHAYGEAAEPDCGSPLLTALHQRMGDKPTSAKTQTAVAKLILRELDSAATPSPLRLLQWSCLLMEIGSELPDPVLFTLWRRTLEMAIALFAEFEAAPAPVEERAFDDRTLLIAGELRWRIGLCFPDVRGAGRLQKSGRSALREGLEALTDVDGIPHAASLHRLPLILAALTRSTAVGAANRAPLWDGNLQERFDALIRHAAGLCLADGRIPLSNGASNAPASLLKTAAQLTGHSRHKLPMQRLLSLADDLATQGKKNRRIPASQPRSIASMRFKEKSSPSSQSDWAELACLRNNWLPGSDSCVITHHQPTIQICLTAFDRLLLYGAWPVEVSVDGSPVVLPGEWSSVCWFSDEDADYLELQQDADNVTVCRQILLSRVDHWLFAADAVVGPDDAGIELTTRLPLAEGVTAAAGRWTREVTVSQGKLSAVAYPLALEQQRVDHARGDLEVQNEQLVLRQDGGRGGVYAPLMFDWSPDRRRGPSLWRRLTVAEDGVIMTPGVAAGFRLRVGKHQWLYYRSLKKGQTARSVLGHHTPHETVIAEFSTTGQVQPLIMVE
ncbi:MAG: hypothetical protein KF861_05340 [Planctomycetaceae bacterium]|nr:hypothetical protein [Planctomycetaceae bacterium]